MIIGIGTDLVEVARLQSSLERYGERFAARILAPEEMQLWRKAPRPAHFLATRFAVKEAASKAFGTGFRDGLDFKHIVIQKDALNKPSLQFYAKAAEMAAALKVTNSHVSLSDERDYALAFVILESNKLDDLI